MPDPVGYLLSEKDLKVLKELIGSYARRQNATTERGPTQFLENQESMTPEVYIAKTPDAGIPANVSMGSTGVGDQPGFAECQVLRITTADPPDIQLITDYKHKVFNLSEDSIEGQKWIVIQRDKFGNWFVAPAVGPGVFIARLTTSTAGFWKYVPLTLTDVGAWDDAGPETDDYVAVPCPIDGSGTNVTFATPPFTGMRVWMKLSSKRDIDGDPQYEFIPATGVTVFEITGNLGSGRYSWKLKAWNGSAWIDDPSGLTGSDLHEVDLYASIPNGKRVITWRKPISGTSTGSWMCMYPNLGTGSTVFSHGCGVYIAGTEIGLDLTDVVQTPLFWTSVDGKCTLGINYGCGLGLGGEDDTLVLDLTGVALSPLRWISGSCTLSLNTGCGLDVVAGNLVVDLTSAVTDGITWGVGEDCALGWRPGCGMTVGVSPADGKEAFTVNLDTLAGDAEFTGLVTVGSPVGAKGDPCPSLGVDLTLDTSASAPADEITGFSVTSGKLRIAWNRRTLVHSDNKAGMPVQVVFGGPVAMHLDVDICDLVECCLAEELTVTCGPVGTGTGSGGSTEGAPPLTVQFLAVPSGGLPPYTYLWDSGDGDTATIADPTFTYNTPGVYFASVVVTDKCGTTVMCVCDGVTVIGGCAGHTNYVPAESCVLQDGSPDLSLATEYDYTYTNALLGQWFRWPVTPSTAYHITLTGTANADTVFVGTGPLCANITGGVLGTVNGNTCADFVTGASDTYIFMRIHAGDLGNPCNTAQLDTGVCP